MSVEIWSIAVFDEQRNPTYSNAFLDFLKDTTGIPENRLEKGLLIHVIMTTLIKGCMFNSQNKVLNNLNARKTI